MRFISVNHRLPSFMRRMYESAALFTIFSLLPGAAEKAWAAFERTATGVNDTSSASETGAVKPIAATPTFKPAGGKYTKPRKVTITDSTAGATIYYALHGVTPTDKSTQYTGPIDVGSSEKIEAIAVAKGYANSAVASADYIIDELPASTPVFTPDGGHYTADQKVAITDSTAGATIYYTTDGTVPTTASTKYTRRIQVSGRETLRAMAEAPDYTRSEVATAHYDITPEAATPVFHPAGGSYPKAQRVTISDASSGVAIYYTTDGKTPTSKSTRYSGPIAVPVSPQIQTIKAIASGSGFTPSAVATATYAIIPLVAKPVFYPLAGTYSNPVSVSLSDSTTKTSIYYTTDGTLPTKASAKYSKPFNVTATETIQAIAFAGGAVSAIGSATYTITAGVTAPPVVSTTPAENGAVVVSLATTSDGATIYYTVDGSRPTTSSQVYLAPFLVSSPLTVNAIAVSPGYSNSPVTRQRFTTKIASGTLVWSDEFSNKTSAKAEPDPLVWTYDTGNSGFGNDELENYCAWGSNDSPCSTAAPNAYVGTDGYLHIVARQPSPGVYTSARLKTQGLFSFQYGRMEVRAMVPEAQGFWPAAWLLGNNIDTVNWPACGEQDNLERVNAATTPDWNEGSIHGTGFTGGDLGTRYNFPAGETAAQWHTYGMIWSEGKVEYYIDDPTSPYATFTPASLDGLTGAVWPFDAGQSNFILLNLAVGGDYPGPPNSTTPFPSEYLIDYVRIYTN
jgi:beta-glucanase (GH16 family)